MYKQTIEQLLRQHRRSKRELAEFLQILPQNLNRVLDSPNISVSHLSMVADFFGMPLSKLLLQEREEKKVPGLMYVPLVQQYAQAGYLAGYSDPEYIDELPTVPFIVDREYKGRYFCFEVAGDSMNDGSIESYLEGDIVLAREISPDFWHSKLHLKRWRDFVIVHREQGVLLKRIVAHDVEEHSIRIHSLNPMYEDRTIDLSEVSQLLNVVRCVRNK